MKTPPDIENEEIASLVARYAEAAANHGRATETGDYRNANTAHEQISAIYRELRRRGIEAQRAVLPLLTSTELGVRAWAGAHALEFAPAEGEDVLEEISEIPKSLVSFSAKTALREWRAGKLRFP